MAETATRIATRERLWRIALALLPGLALVLLRGVDTSWDLRNYHLYNPHAWLTGRLLLDIAPAQLQTWHNPVLDVPLYLLVRSGWDLRWASAWLVLPWAVAIYLLLGLQARLSPSLPTRPAQVVLALLALSGATTWATIGSSTNDGFVAAALLGSLSLLMHADERGARSWLLAGLLAGAMAGLKLTAGAFCLALAVTALFGTDGRWRAAPRRLLALGAGGLLGFLLTYGWWGWTLQQMFGNPFFPYFNDVFGSAAASARDYVDARFQARGLLDAATIPFQLLRDDTARSELYIRDPRLLLAAIGLPGYAAWSRRRRTQGAGFALALAVFFWTALLAWGLQSGIYRYAALLELLGTLALVLWLAELPRWRHAVLLLALVGVSKATHRPDWGHVRGETAQLGIPRVALPDDALVIIASGDPLAYASLALPPRVRVVSVANNMMTPGDDVGLQRRARAAIAGHAGSLWLLSQSAASSRRDATLLVREFGLAAAPAGGIGHASTFGTVVFAPLVRQASRPAPR